MAWATAARINPVEPRRQSRRVAFTISMIVGDPAPLLPHPPGPGSLELHLGGGVLPVAELVFEPLDPEAFLVPSGRTRGRRKQR
jgi:hypothetical protein